MHRRIHFHPSPLTILVAIVLCLIASAAFGQVRRVGPGTTTAPAATTGLPTGAPSPSGLTSGAAPGLVSGTPSASGLTSGTAGGNAAFVVPTAPADTSATATGGSTRGIVVIPADPGAGAATTGAGTTGAAGTATGTAGTTAGAAGFGTTTGAAGTTGVFVAQPGSAAALSNGVPSVSPTRVQMGGPMTSLQVLQMFSQADADADGLLTRAEALRLPMVTMSFDDMDANRDGVVSRSEYDASLR